MHRFAFGAGLLVLAAMTTESGRTNIKKAIKSLVWTGYFAKGAATDLLDMAKKCRKEMLAEKETTVKVGS